MAQSRRRMDDPMRPADDDAPFSESMLEWLEEGDRMGDAHKGTGPRPSGPYHPIEGGSRRTRYFIGGGVLLVGLFVGGLKIFGGHKAEGDKGAKAVAAAAHAPTPAAAPSAPPTAAEPAPLAAAPATTDPAAGAPTSADQPP